MARERFEHEMRRLAERIVELGAVAEAALADAVAALRGQDLERARALIEADRRINETRFELENEAITLIATQQPVAVDLRALAAVFEIATELERIADYAKGIATITLSIGSRPLLEAPADLGQLLGMAADARRSAATTARRRSRCSGVRPLSLRISASFTPSSMSARTRGRFPLPAA